MIVIIALGTLTSLCILLFIVFCVLDEKSAYTDYFNLKIASIIFFILSFAMFAICGGIVLSHNSSEECLKVREECTEKIVDFSLRKELISSVEDNTYQKYYLVTKYNQDLKDFKEKILNYQEDLKNPWRNWFICKEYANIDVSTLTSIDLIKAK